MGQSEVYLEETIQYVWLIRFTKVVMIEPIIVYLLSVIFDIQLTSTNYLQLSIPETVGEIFWIIIAVALVSFYIRGIYEFDNNYRYLGLIIAFLVLISAFRHISDLFVTFSMTLVYFYSTLKFLFSIFYSVFAIYTLSLHRETLELFTLDPEPYSTVN